VNIDALSITGTYISATDSTSVTVNDDLNVVGNLTANSVIGEVSVVGSSGAGVTTVNTQNGVHN
jgi:hypothetical protein